MAGVDRSTEAPAASWVTLAHPADNPQEAAGAVMSTRHMLIRLALATLAVLLLVTLAGSYAARRLAELEAVNDAANTADVLADAVVQPSLTDALMAGDPRAVPAFDKVMRAQVLTGHVVRVKIWSATGTVRYADESQLIGQTFSLDQARREVLTTPTTRAEVSTLDEPENEFEKGDRLLEVYRPVWSPDGQLGLFEIYTSYEPVRARTSALWRGFAGITLSSLLLLILLMAPLLWNLFARLRDNQKHREALLVRAVDASDAERQRIAASLHDGPVQELAAASFTIAGNAARARSGGDEGVAATLDSAAATVRSTIGSLRSLLVDIFPPSLDSSGLNPTLTDLARQAGTRGVAVELDIADVDLTPDQRRLVYRVAQECLRNTVTHAAPCRARLSLCVDDGSPVLEVVDDGPGFDPVSVQRDRRPGHFGLQVLVDLATAAGARLDLASAPGHGTRWRLVLGPGGVTP